MDVIGKRLSILFLGNGACMLHSISIEDCNLGVELCDLSKLKQEKLDNECLCVANLKRFLALD